jgi:hypothetical protein
MVVAMFEGSREFGRMMGREVPMDYFRPMAVRRICRMNVLSRQDRQPEHTEYGKDRDDSPAGRADTRGIIRQPSHHRQKSQYDTESDSTGVNTRLRWTFRRGGGLVVVYNHNVRSTRDRCPPPTAPARRQKLNFA